MRPSHSKERQSLSDAAGTLLVDLRILCGQLETLPPAYRAAVLEEMLVGWEKTTGRLALRTGTEAIEDGTSLTGHPALHRALRTALGLTRTSGATS